MEAVQTPRSRCDGRRCILASERERRKRRKGEKKRTRDGDYPAQDGWMDGGCCCCFSLRPSVRCLDPWTGPLQSKSKSSEWTHSLIRSRSRSSSFSLSSLLLFSSSLLSSSFAFPVSSLARIKFCFSGARLASLASTHSLAAREEGQADHQVNKGTREKETNHQRQGEGEGEDLDEKEKERERRRKRHKREPGHSLQGASQ